ncbi:MAG: MmcQ/YjbR family DNA-binding protein, partial [Terriglobales bacterium]
VLSTGHPLEFPPGQRWLTQRGDFAMTAADFRRIALGLEGSEEGSHMGAADFRVGGRIFATLASEAQGYGNLMLTPEQQADFVRELPEVFLPVRGGWGRMGATHIRLARATEDVLAGALRTAWQLRVEKNAKAGRRKRADWRS